MVNGYYRIFVDPNKSLLQKNAGKQSDDPDSKYWFPELKKSKQKKQSERASPVRAVGYVQHSIQELTGSIPEYSKCSFIEMIYEFFIAILSLHTGCNVR